ncbi:5-demethoxyubiquinone hydroxylase, mitochondrial-like [Symsagittifera roscoffensis]|uniref:5-demethoxyubiquinone hydroxylase, mitochondrial-like n=1 Tax=Symsagittifera roscoffensis TaxID=84072 RepID=UPI00307C60DB
MNISSGCKLCTRFVRSGRTPQVLLSSSAAATTEKLTMEKSEQRRKRRKILDQILRVDHAGELGANYIYKGQLKALGSSSPAAKTIEDMWSHEKEHLATLEEMMPRERTRPSLLQPLWQCAGYTLGYASGLMGEKVAMACTDAVEEAIVDHYNEQIRELLEKQEENQDSYEDVAQILSKMRDEEQHHMDVSKENDSESAPLYSVMKSVIKTGCKVAIFAAEKV